MIDPPADCKQHAENCRNSGTWPVLLGQPGDASHLLAAPIILYDYPQIAPESPGDLFDGGEIDEILSLRILTLTDDEKQQIRSGDPVGKAMLERTERLSEQDMLQLHGTWRTTGGERSSPGLQPGTRVRIQPKKCNDAFDLILSGMTATVEKIEEDLDGGFHAVVALDDDPGRDLAAKAQLGHRFFYRPEDLQPL
jgi:hydrogenase maturation protease